MNAAANIAKVGCKSKTSFVFAKAKAYYGHEMAKYRNFFEFFQKNFGISKKCPTFAIPKLTGHVPNYFPADVVKW